MKILIVDDNKSNRMILSLLLEEYREKHPSLEIVIDEVADGLQAVDAVKKMKYDLIFMDIMMPQMDGVKATSIIRHLDKKVMIIAVSAVDDNDRKKIILNNGAEDYISKPVNADVFNVRLHSYIRLLESRKMSTSSSVRLSKPHNLFTKNIYSYETHFNGENEDMLSSFWEYYLLNDTPYEGTSDMVRFIFDMGLISLEDGHIDIYEENTDEMMYLTLISEKAYDPDAIMLYADKNNFVNDYKLKDNTLSVKLKKERIMTCIESHVANPIENTVIKTNLQREVNIVIPSSELSTFNILDSDDFEDLKDYISRLNSLLLILGSSTIDETETDEMITTLLRIAKSISAYTDLYKVGSALGTLGNAIHEHKASFIEKSLDIGPLAVAFGGDLSHWFKSLFISGATSIDFLDASIVSNAHMIEGFINPSMLVDTGSNTDDIFDF